MELTVRDGGFSIEEVNRMARLDPKTLFALSEERYTAQIERVGALMDGRRVLLLAGPSASGKTTSAKRIRRLLSRGGRDVVVVSLDDFFRDRETLIDENGEKDYDSLNAYDVDFVRESLSALLDEGVSFLPSYDFETGRRLETLRPVRLKRNGVLILEGIHALNDVFARDFASFGTGRVYVSPHTGFVGENGTLTKRELRLTRRVVRDERSRFTPADETLDLWRSVCEAEDLYIRPLAPSADLCIDTTHPVEPCLLRRYAMKAYSSVPASSPYAAQAAEMKEKVAVFEPLPKRLLTRGSLLWEFLK